MFFDYIRSSGFDKIASICSRNNAAVLRASLYMIIISTYCSNMHCS
nr:MAG TPA: hypothetical protein [Bacteriophage sp.]